jgi:hypothetical protein
MQPGRVASRNRLGSSAPVFGARGLVYLGARDFFTRNLPGGLAALDTKLSPELAEFWNRIFIAGSMYDALPIVPISRTAAELAGVSHLDFVRANAEWLADRDIRGVYRLLLDVLSAETLVTRLPKAAMRYFNFGEASAQVVRRGFCRTEQRGIPEPMASWFAACVEGFILKALSRARARSVAVKTLTRTVTGKRDGIEILTLEFGVYWEP